MKMLKKLLTSTRAQSTAEYAVIVFFCVLAGLLFVYVFAGAMATHHSNVSSVICLPVP
ncbi:MAG: hypothetical protein HQ592_04255 [Planctomycetes bacterium]|nr:hypothetical protein [Planctomycetota bacterium]